MPEILQPTEGEKFVVPDESFRVSDVRKARTMAEASHIKRTDAAIDREIDFQRTLDNEKREAENIPLKEFTDNKAAEAIAHDAEAEKQERFAGQHFEADKLVEAVGERVGLETVYNFEQRAAEAKRDTEALQRTLDGLFDKPGREQDIQSLQRVLNEAQDRQATYEYAFSKLRVKSMEQTSKGHQFWDDYNAYKKSLTSQETK